MSIHTWSCSLLASFALLACGSTDSTDPATNDAGSGADAQEAQPDADARDAQPVTPDAPETESPLAIATQVDGSLRVELLAGEALHVGLNRVYFRLHDEGTGAAVTHAAIAQHPLMDMGQMKHACPFVDPAEEADAAGLFGAEIVFSMASGMGTWSDALDIDLAPAGEAHHVVFDALDVAETEMRKLVTAGSDSYLVTLNFTATPVVGAARFVLTVHAKQSPMSFPPAPEVTVALRTGPSDGALGEPVTLTYTENGKYDGTAMFSAAGRWALAFELSRAGTALGTAAYAIDL